MITNVFVPVVIARLVIPQSSDHVILNGIAGDVRRPRQFLPSSQALTGEPALGHRVMHGEKSLQGLGQLGASRAQAVERLRRTTGENSFSFLGGSWCCGVRDLGVPTCRYASQLPRHSFISS